VDKYTTSFQFNPTIEGDIPFLKERLATGDTWASPEYIGPSNAAGQTIYLQYDFSCLNADAAVTISGKTFVNVYEIEMKPTLRSALTYPYQGTGEIYRLYYAKGVGLIYMKLTSLGFTLKEFQIRTWQVN
jgi:hypothetical protein